MLRHTESLILCSVSGIKNIHTVLGGADGRYTYVDGYDYRSEHMKSGVAFLQQGIHRTLVHHYNDTVNILVYSTQTNMTTVQVHVCKMF